MDTSAIYHIQDPNSSHGNTVHIHSVKVIPVPVNGVKETLVNGVPFLDKLEEKFSNSLGEKFSGVILISGKETGLLLIGFTGRWKRMETFTV